MASKDNSGEKIIATSQPRHRLFDWTKSEKPTLEELSEDELKQRFDVAEAAGLYRVTYPDGKEGVETTLALVDQHGSLEAIRKKDGYQLQRLREVESYRKPLRDSHGHWVIQHDLFNHDGLTQDGIAEAFAEFAAKENLGFF